MLIHLDNKYFEKIKEGTKTIELRLYDEKRRKIKTGDIIEFENRETEERIEVEVINVHIFPSFKEVYDTFDKISLGYYENETANYTDMEKYYSKEDVEKYGVCGIELKLI